MRWVDITGSSSLQRARVAANLAVLAACGKIGAGLCCADLRLSTAAAAHGVATGSSHAGPGVAFASEGVPAGSGVVRLHLLETPTDDLFHVEQGAHPPVRLAVVGANVDAFERAVRRRKAAGLEPVLPYRVPVLNQEPLLVVVDADMSPNAWALMELLQEIMSDVG